MVQQKHLIFKRNEKSELKCFLDYLEIFMNEIRKFEIAIGEYECEGMNIPSNNLRRERKVFLSNNLSGNVLNHDINTPRQSQNHTPHMIQIIPTSNEQLIAEESDEDDDDVNYKKNKFSNKQEYFDTTNNQVVYNSIYLDTETRLVSSFEAIFVFSMTWSLANQIKDKYQSTYIDFLNNQIESYCKFRSEHTKIKYTSESYPFAVDLRLLLKEKDINVFDYVYDIHKQKWIKWRNYFLDECSEISGSFESNNINNREIVRLNPLAISVVNTKLTQEKKEVYIPENLMFIETRASKITKYFIQYFASYNKPYILLAQQSNGITSIVKNKLKNLQEHHSFSCINNSISRGTTISNFQRRVEKNLVWKNSNHLTSIHQTVSLVFIDDLNLSKDGISPIGAIRSLIQHNGWFSNNKFRYINFSLFTLLGVFSYFDINSLQPTVNTVLFEKITSLKVQSLETNDIVSIFQQYNSTINHPGMKADKKVIEIVSDFCSLLGLLNDKYRQEFKKISCQFNANLSIRKGLEIVKNLNTFSFYDKSTKMINNESLIKSLIFLINQYFSSEFIHQPYPNQANVEKQKNKVKEVDQISLKTNSEIGDGDGDNQLLNSIDKSQSFSETSSDNDNSEDNSDSTSSISSNPASSSSEKSAPSQHQSQQILQKKLSTQLKTKKKKKKITKKFNIVNLHQIKIIKQKFSFPADKKIEWFLGIIDLPEIEYNDDVLPQNINSPDQDADNITGSESKKQGNQFFANSPQILGKQQSKFKQEHEEKKTIEVDNQKFKFENEELKEEDKEGSSINSKDVEDESESDFYNQNNGLIPQLGLKSNKLISFGFIQDSGLGDIEQIKKQQIQFEVEKEAQLEERRFQQQERKIGSSHYQISRDVTNAQKQQFIINHQNQAQNNQRSYEKTPIILEKLDKIQFAFTAFSTLPDQFTTELTHHIVHELLQIQEAEQKQLTMRNIQQRKKQRGNLTNEVWQNILRMRQDLLFFNQSLIHKDKYVKALSKQISKQNNGGVQSIKTNQKIANTEMNLFDDLDFTYMEDKKRKKTLLYLVEKLITFCLDTSQATDMGGLSNSKQLDLNKMFEDFQEKQFKKIRSLRNRSDSFMRSKSNLSIKRDQSVEGKDDSDIQSPKSQQGQKNKMIMSNAVSSINIVQVPPPKKSRGNNKQNFQFTSQQMEQIQNLKMQSPPSLSPKNQISDKKSNLFTYTSRGGDLLDIILIQEININCFLTHVIKLIHLLQSSNQNIYLKSTLSQRMTEHILYFSCSLLNMVVHEFSIENDEEPHKIQKRFYNQLFQAVQNLFIDEDKIIIFYVKLSSSFLTSDEQIQDNLIDENDEFSNNKRNTQKIRLESIQALYDHINHIIEGGEVSSLFTTQQIEFLMQKWKMKTKYPRFNNYILNYIFSLRLKSHFRFILHQDLQPRQDTTLEYLQNEFSHMFQQFTKLNIYYIPLPNDESQAIQIILYQEMFNQIPDYIYSKHKTMIIQAYSKELEVSKIFEDSWKTNVQRTYEETFSLFFITRNIIFNQIRFKIEKIRRKGGFLKIIQEMEKKSVEFKEEIEKAEKDFIKTKETKKQMIKALQEAEERFSELKKLEEQYSQREKTIQDMIIKCQQTEGAYRSISQQMSDTALKISKINKNSWNDEIKPQTFVQIKQMTVYMLIFLIGLHRVIPDKYNVNMQQLADDVVDSISEVNKNSVNFNNIEIYREKFFQIISDQEEFKNIITTFKDEHIKSNTFDLFKCLNKEGGSSDHGHMISLTGNLNIHQREILKYIDLIIEMYRLTIEIRNLQTTSAEQRDLLRQLKEERDKSQLEKNMQRPRQIINENPSMIEKMKKEQRNLMIHIVEKKNGYQQFNNHLEKFKIQFKHIVTEDSCQLIFNSFLNEISVQLALQVTFLIKYPFYVVNKFEDLIHDCLHKSGHLKDLKLFNALFNSLYYYQIVQYQIPLNQDLINKITITDFLYEHDLYYYFWVHDKTGLYYQYIKKKYDKTLIIESDTLVPKESHANIEKALQEGNFLLLRNVDEQTIQEIMPIIEWKYKRMMKLLRFFIQNAQKENHWQKNNVDPHQNILNHEYIWFDQSLFDFNEQTRIKSTINFNGKEIIVHKNFRLMLITSNLNFSFSHTIFTKFIFLQCEVEDEYHWKQTIFDHMVNNLNFQSKQNQVSMKIDHINIKRETLSKLFSQISIGLQKCVSCEDQEFIRLLIDNSEQIKNNIGMQQTDALNIPIIQRGHSDEEISPNKKRIIKELVQVGDQNSNANKQIEKIEFQQEEEVEEQAEQKQNLPQDQKISEIIKLAINVVDDPNNQQQAIQNQGDNQNIEIGQNRLLSTLEVPQHSRSRVNSEQIDSDKSQIKSNNIISSKSSLSKNSIRRSQTIGVDSIHSFASRFNYSGLKRKDSQIEKIEEQQQKLKQNMTKSIQKKRKVLQIQTNTQKQKEKNINFIGNNYYQLNELVIQNSCLQEVLDFLYAIKLNYINLEKALGSVYSFSDLYFFMIIQQACVKCIQLKITPPSYSSQQTKQKKIFIKKFSEIVFHLLYSSMAEDHRILFSFYLSMMYSRGTNQFSEKEWKIFLNWSVPSLEAMQPEDEDMLDTLDKESESKPIKQRRDHSEKQNQITLKQQLKQNKNNWNKINQKLINFFKLPNNIIAPLVCFVQEKQSLLEKFVERKEILKDSDETTPRGGLGFSMLSKKLGLKEKILKQQMLEQEQQDLEERGYSSPKASGESTPKSDKSFHSNFSLLSPQIISNKQQFQNNSSNESSPKNAYNPLFRKFQDRSEMNTPYQQDSDEIIEGTDKKLSSPYKTSKQIMNTSVQSASRAGSKIPSQFMEFSKKPTVEINYQNFKPSNVMKYFSKKFTHLMGKEILERFVESFTHFQVKGSIKLAINSLIEQPENWIEFIQKSLTDYELKEEDKKELANDKKKQKETLSIEEEDEEDDQEDEQKQKQKLYENHKVDAVNYIPYLPKDIISNCSPLQILFIFKHFRPDFLPQAAEYISQKMLKGFIDYELAPLSFESHCEQDWQKRPTILLHDQVQNRIFEQLELIQSLQNSESSLLRISLGYTQIGSIVDQINQAAGAGRWILLDEIEKMETNDLKYLLRTLDQELEASTTTKSFKVWITHNASLNKENNLYSFKPFHFSKNGQILLSYYQTCWKIYYTGPKNIQQAMQRFYYRDIHDYRYNFEQQKVLKSKQTKEVDFYTTKIEKEIIIKKNIIYGNVIQMLRRYNLRQGLIPYPVIDSIDDGFFSNQSSLSVAQSITMFSPKYLNIFSLIDFADKKAILKMKSNRHIPIVDNSASEKEDYKTMFIKFLNKFKFSLAFLHCCIGRKRELTNNIFKSYDSQLNQSPNEMFETDQDFYQEIQSVFNLLQYYPINPRDFLEKYIKMVYGFNNPYYTNMVLHFVFSNMEGSLKLIVKNQTYLLYDFNSGVFDYVEEGVTKILAQQFPQTSDPLELFFSNVNNQLIQDYSKSKQFMNRINLIEDEWSNNSLVKSLRYLEKIKKIVQIDDQQKDTILKDVNASRQSMKRKISKDIKLDFNTGMLSPILQKERLSIQGLLKNQSNKSENSFGGSNSRPSLTSSQLQVQNDSDEVVEGVSNDNLKKPSIADMLNPSAKSITQTEKIPSGESQTNQRSPIRRVNTKKPSIGFQFGSFTQSKELLSPISPPIPEIVTKQESNQEGKDLNLLSFNQSLSYNRNQSQVPKFHLEHEDELIGKIQHQMKSFFKVYYRNLLSSHEKYKELKSILENLLKNLSYEFHLKEIKFLRYHQNIKTSHKQPEEYPEFINQWVSQQDNSENNSDLIQLKYKQKSVISFNSLPHSSILRPSELIGSPKLSFASPRISIATPNRGSIQFSLTPQSSNSPHQQRVITQMNLTPSMGGIFGAGAAKSSFSEKVRQSRRESTTAHLLIEEQKKYLKQQENQKIISGRRESSLRFADQLTSFKNKNSSNNEKLNESDEDKQSSDDSNNSSQTSSEESSDDIDVIEDIEKNTFKSTLLNECIILFRLIMQMKSDIRSVIDFISHQFDLQPIGQRNYLKQIINDIQQNIIPETWRKLSFKVTQRNLCNYLQILFQKIQYTRTLVERGPSLQMPTVIQIDKFVDCHTFLGSYMYNYAEANNIDILKLKFVLQKTSYAEIQKKAQPEEGFYIKGLYLNNGLIHKDTSYLVEEEIRQFQYELPVYYISIARKLSNRQEIYKDNHRNKQFQNKQVSSNYQQSIAIELNDHNVQVLRYDMENEYLFQQLHPINLYNYDGLQINAESKKIEEKSIATLVNVINQGNEKRSSLTPQAKNNLTSKQAAKKKEDSFKDANQDKNPDSPNKDDFSSYKQAQINLSKIGPKELKFQDLYSQQQYTFVVKIPFKNPCTSSAYSHMQSKFYLYINSRKPQDYWELKGTTLVAYKQIF